MKGTITITRAEADSAVKQPDQRDKEVIIENFAPFIDCISEINHTQIDNTNNIDTDI